LENPGKVELELIEVQSGSYLCKDDIIRLRIFMDALVNPEALNYPKNK